MIDYAQLKSTGVPPDAIREYDQYDGDLHATASVKDYDALATKAEFSNSTTTQ